MRIKLSFEKYRSKQSFVFYFLASFCIRLGWGPTFVVPTINTYNSKQYAGATNKTTTPITGTARGSKAAAQLPLKYSPLLFFFLFLGIFVQFNVKYLIKNQPIHDQLLLYCLVKWKRSRGTVDKKKSKAILEIDCWPRRYIFLSYTSASLQGSRSLYLYRQTCHEELSRHHWPIELSRKYRVCLGVTQCVYCFGKRKPKSWIYFLYLHCLSPIKCLDIVK